MPSRIAVCAGLSAIVLSGCASTRADFGGVMNPLSVPEDTVKCEVSHWRPVDRVAPVYPEDLAMYLFDAQVRSTSFSFDFTFDIDETGSTANIRYVGRAGYMRNSSVRTAIRASAEAIAQWRYEADGEVVHATGCTVEMDFVYANSPPEPQDSPADQ